MNVEFKSKYQIWNNKKTTYYHFIVDEEHSVAIVDNDVSVSVIDTEGDDIMEYDPEFAEKIINATHAIYERARDEI